MKESDWLKRQVDRQARRKRQAERDQSTLMAHTAYLTTLGLLFVIPIVAGAYLGDWLDSMAPAYHVRWTVGLLLLGVVVGAVNAYLFVKQRSR